jgi:hypothetical protein
MRTDHNINEGGTYTCIYCKSVFKTYSVLKNHLDLYHDDEVIRCENCRQLFKTEDQKTEHIKKFHDIKTIPCIICGKRIHGACDLNIHMKYNHKDMAIKCRFRKYCKNWFKSKEDLQKHIEKDHQHLKFDCMYCDKGHYTNRIQLNHHVRRNHKNEALWCEYTRVCGTHFKTEEDRQKHYKEKHENNAKNLRTCIFCNKKFNRLGGALKHHLNFSHPNEKYFKCRYLPCVEYFKTEKEKRKHEKDVHECFDEKYKCIFCKKFFFCEIPMRNSKLQAHIRYAHSDVAIKCNFNERCPNYFKTEEDRDKHKVEFHKSRKRKYQASTCFSCATCPEQFYKKAKLRDHVIKCINKK